MTTSRSAEPSRRASSTGVAVTALSPRPLVGLERGRPLDVPPEAGVDPYPARRLPVPRQGRPGRLRRQGQEPAGAALVVLPGRRQPAPAHRQHGHHRGLGGVDRGRHRGRGPAAGVLLDQGVRPAVQREVPRRQVLPVARHHHERGVPAGDGRPGREEEGREVLRPLQPRLGHPRDRRPAAARLPDALVQQRGVQAVLPDRPTVPARLHREVLGPVRRPRRRRGAPPRSPRTSPTSWAVAPTRSSSASEREMYAASEAQDYERAARLRDDLGALQQGAGEAGGGLRRRHRRRRDRARRGPARGGGADLPRALRSHPRPARLGRRPGRGHRHRRPGQRVPAAALRGRGGGRDPARDPGAGDARGRRHLRGAARRDAGEQGRHPGAAARGQASAAGDGGQERRAVPGAAQDQARQRPDRPQPGARGDPGGARPAVGAAADRVLRRLQPPGHRGGRPRWWSSRTACRARASTAGS